MANYTVVSMSQVDDLTPMMGFETEGVALTYAAECTIKGLPPEQVLWDPGLREELEHITEERQRMDYAVVQAAG